MPGKLGQLVTRNWPIKLVAVFLALMLYVAVAAQQPTTQLFQLKLAVDLPPGRALASKAPTVAVQISGRGSELMKLRAFPPVIKRAVPDTLAGAVWTVRLQPGDVQIPRGIDVRVDDIAPREIELLLDAVARKEVRIVPRVEVVAESGYVLQGGLSLTPAIARVVGPDEMLASIESVTTVPVQLSGVTGPFVRTVPVDTAALGIVRVIPKEVEISGNVGALAERSFAGIPVETGAGALTGFVVNPSRVSVAVRGPEEIVTRLTRDSIRVVASLRGAATSGSYARLTVVVPRGLTARAVPDSVALQRRTGRRG
ncbi:MAG TPA: CdaR family protein [Gemmatimonadales bacterium]|nr:CdaR family protein [Gemmatimonadales bacterium]